MKYAKDETDQVTIESVEFDDSGVELFVEEQELERVDDNDYDMEPPARWNEVKALIGITCKSLLFLG